jgi:hypothetical protein
LLGVASVLESVGKLLGTRLKVVVPAEPATVTSINVHHDVGKVEILKSVCNTFTVARSGVLASLEIGVGDQVRKGIGLDDESKGGVGVCLDLGDNGINVGGLVCANVSGLELTVGCFGSAVTSWKIVDDETEDV